MSVAQIAIEIKKLTKRTILQKLTLIYDPPGLILPTTIIEKSSVVIFVILKFHGRNIGDETPNTNKYTKNNQFVLEVLKMIDIHVFENSTFLGTCTVAYAVIQQPSRVKQELITC